MTNVEFEESRDDMPMAYGKKKLNGLKGFIRKIGLAKSEKGANAVLVILGIICLLAAVLIYGYFVLFPSSGSVSSFPPPHSRAHIGAQPNS